MTITAHPPEQTAVRATVSHPLDPLTADEIVEAVSILRAERGLGKETRFETVTLNEPTKEVVLGFKSGDPFDREAFFIVFDNRTSETHEADSFADERRGSLLDAHTGCPAAHYPGRIFGVRSGGEGRSGVHRGPRQAGDSRRGHGNGGRLVRGQLWRRGGGRSASRFRALVAEDGTQRQRVCQANRGGHSGR